jgi:predicted nucleotidyltransferase
MTLTRFANIVAEWAASEPLVEAAYLFGSRAKGFNRPDSDLDVALKVSGDDEGFTNWISEASGLRKSLGNLLPVPVDLQMMHSLDAKVTPAVREHGTLVFKRDQK